MDKKILSIAFENIDNSFGRIFTFCNNLSQIAHGFKIIGMEMVSDTIYNFTNNIVNECEEIKEMICLIGNELQ